MKKKRIAVAGSANMDVVLHMAKAPGEGESVLVDSQRFIPGGKGANRAVALARLGANPLFSCCLGDDDFGNTLFEIYRSEKMDDALISRLNGHATGTAYIYVENGGRNRIAICSGANGRYGKDNIDMLVSRFDSISMLSVELEIPADAVERLNYESVRAGVPCVIDAGPIRNVDASIFKGAYILSPNESEAQALTGIMVNDVGGAKDACRALYEIGVKFVIIKLGARGSICYDGSDFIISEAYNGAGKVVDTTAAGDCYMSALCYALSLGIKMENAMRYAGIASGISVTRSGAIPSLPKADEVERCFNEKNVSD